MKNESEYIGKKYGFVLILKYIGYVNYKIIVLGKCDCGIEKEFRLCSLEEGATKSCGCYKKMVSKNKRENRVIHGLIKHPIYKLWYSIKRRCYYKLDLCYKYYGGNGVIMCNEWLNDFMNFYNWCINNGWKKGLQIDKDILGDGKLYSPETCCFVTPKVNCNNKTNNRVFIINHIEYTMSELADRYSINYKALFARLKLGWDIIKAIETPLRNFKKKIYVEDLNGNYVGIFNGCRDVQVSLGVPESTVSYCVNRVKKAHSKYKFTYV